MFFIEEVTHEHSGHAHHQLILSGNSLEEAMVGLRLHLKQQFQLVVDNPDAPGFVAGIAQEYIDRMPEINIEVVEGVIHFDGYAPEMDYFIVRESTIY